MDAVSVASLYSHWPSSAFPSVSPSPDVSVSVSFTSAFAVVCSVSGFVCSVLLLPHPVILPAATAAAIMSAIVLRFIL